MKTTGNFHFRLKSLFFVLVISSNLLHSQENFNKAKALDNYLKSLKAEISFNPKLPQSYRVTSYFYNRDIAGNTANNIRMTGEFTRSIRGEQIYCSWKNVQIAGSPGSADSYLKIQSLDFMNGLSYSYSEEMLKPEFFKNFPDKLRDVLKTLIWDTPWIEVLYMSLDKLKYNEPYTSVDFEGKEFQMADFAMLKMKDLRLTWSGLAKMDDRLCALIEYKSFSNPVESVTDAMNVKGRSCCWGSFWIALDDNLVERVTLNEDVVLKLSLPNIPGEQVINIQRDVVFDKME